jgi:hypothetical protein
MMLELTGVLRFFLFYFFEQDNHDYCSLEQFKQSNRTGGLL